MQRAMLTRHNRFDSSVGRGDFVTAIGVGQVIKGKDELLQQIQQIYQTDDVC